MKVTREYWHHIFNSEYCPVCGKDQEFNPVKTGLPGIAAKQCKICKMGYQANYLEDDQALINFPDSFKFPTK